MKKLLAQSIGLIALVGIVFLVNEVSAGNPASGPSAAFPNGNTAFPITVGTYPQVKGAGAPPAPGGGLVIGSVFVARLNASFDKEVGIQGILTGEQVGATTNSNLSFGDASAGNQVDVNITGTTYATGGHLYAPVENAPAGMVQALCANQQGEIILCPTATPYIPLSIR